MEKYFSLTLENILAPLHVTSFTWENTTLFFCGNAGLHRPLPQKDKYHPFFCKKFTCSTAHNLFFRVKNTIVFFYTKAKEI
jgi:hypothetical protein